MTNIALGERYEQEVDLLVEEGRFGNRSEAVRAAINALYDALPKETRMQVAVRAYKHGVTLGRAAEIGRLSYGELRKMLSGMHMLVGPPSPPSAPVAEVAPVTAEPSVPAAETTLPPT